MAKTFTQIAYAAWGLAILNYVVPTAATAGLLTIAARTLDGSAVGVQMWLGWFTAVLFVISSGHSKKHDDQETVLGIVFDLAETVAMVGVFHALGLVTTDTYLSNGAFYLWLAGYLVSIVVRRAIRSRRGDATVVALKSSSADKVIVFFTWIVMLACLAFGLLHGRLSFDSLARADFIGAIALWAVLSIYLILTAVRESQLP